MIAEKTTEQKLTALARGSIAFVFIMAFMIGGMGTFFLVLALAGVFAMALGKIVDMEFEANRDALAGLGVYPHPPEPNPGW